MEEDLPSKWKLEKAWVAALISDKTDFILYPVKDHKDKEGHYIIIKGSIQKDNLT